MYIPSVIGVSQEPLSWIGGARPSRFADGYLQASDIYNLHILIFENGTIIVPASFT